MVQVPKAVSVCRLLLPLRTTSQQRINPRPSRAHEPVGGPKRTEKSLFNSALLTGGGRERLVEEREAAVGIGRVEGLPSSQAASTRQLASDHDTCESNDSCRRF